MRMGNETESGGVEGEWAGTEARLDGDAPAPKPPTDVAFDLLSRSHRRFVLYCLYRHDGGVDLPQLAERVAKLSEESQADAVADHDRLLTRLSHTTLPRLADAGIVVFDREAGVVWPTGAIAAMGPLLELSASLDFESAAGANDLLTE